jgi:hypothetical protein
VLRRTGWRTARSRRWRMARPCRAIRPPRARKATPRQPPRRPAPLLRRRGFRPPRNRRPTRHLLRRQRRPRHRPLPLRRTRARMDPPLLRGQRPRQGRPSPLLWRHPHQDRTAAARRSRIPPWPLWPQRRMGLGGSRRGSAHPSPVSPSRGRARPAEQAGPRRRHDRGKRRVPGHRPRVDPGGPGRRRKQDRNPGQRC